MKRINRKSDFDILLTFKDCNGNYIDFPTCDWIAVFWAGTKNITYEASCIGGVFTNCFKEENGNVHFVINGHQLGVGVLNWELHVKIPNDIYPDSIQNLYRNEPLDIELVSGQGDCPTTAEIEVLMPYIKGDKGDKLTYADLTEQDKLDLIQPIRDEVDKKANRSELSNIIGKEADKELEVIEPNIVTEVLRKVPQTLTPEEQAQVKKNIGVSKMELFCDLFNKAAGDFGYARITDGSFDCMLNGFTLTYEEAVGIYECGTITSTGSAARFHNFPYKTNLPPKGYGGATSLQGVEPIYKLDKFYFPNGNANNILEVLNLYLPQGMTIADPAEKIICLEGSFAKRSKLTRILGVLHINLIKRPRFIVAPYLEEVSLSGLFYSCDLSGVPKLNLKSYQYLVERKYANHPASPVVTVCPDVYAKLTDESNTEWHQILIDAAAKNITFTTT